MSINTIEELIADIRQGKLIILMDDENRENEGDLIMAAQKVTPQHINFMITHGRGLVCAPLSQEKCRQLQLPLMSQRNQSRYGTNFTVSVEAAVGVTTGISAFERAHTIKTLVNPNSTPADIVQPGHIFPIMAAAGGVLERRGHTEASVDLAHLAGFEKVAVLCEILNEDGTMARRPELEVFAKKHGLKMGTVADLVKYRMKEKQHRESQVV